MSKLKDQIIEQEANFWDKAQSLIGSCSNFNLYQAAVLSLAPNFLINSPSSITELTEQLQEGWSNYWENKSE